MERRKVVCFVNHTAEMGGAEFALARLIGELDQSAWVPVVVFGEDGPAAERVRSSSVECYVLPLDPQVRCARRESLRGLGLQRTLLSLRYVLRLRAFFRDRAVDVVHTNSMKAHVLGGLAARLAGVPLFWHLRDSLHPSALPFGALWAMRTLARVLPKKLIAVSGSVARDALGAGSAESARVVYDGVAPECFKHHAAVAAGIPEGGLWTVGIVGRLCPWKGQHLFLEAAKELLARKVPVRFEILGGPLFGQEPYEASLHNFVAEHFLGERVRFEGFVHNVSERILKWDILVHASTAPDPCPNVVIEAMAAGVPVVGAASGGVPELLEQGMCGVLCAMDDAGELARAIQSLLSAPGERERISKAAAHRARLLFRSERVAREVEQEWLGSCGTGRNEGRRWPWIEDGPRGYEGLKRNKSRGEAGGVLPSGIEGRPMASIS